MRKIYLGIALLLGSAVFLTFGLFYARRQPQQTGSIAKPKINHNDIKRIAPSWSIDLKAGNGIAVSRNKKLLAIGTGEVERSLQFGTDGQIQVWDLDKRILLFRLHDSKAITTVDISPDFKSIVSCNFTSIVKQWSIAQKKVIKEYKDPDGERVFNAVLSPDGKWLATSLGDAVRLWDLMTGKVTRTIQLDGEGHVYDLEFSPTGTELGIGRSWSRSSFWEKPQTPGNSRIYDVTRTGVVKSFGGKAKTITDIAFSPDGKQFASLDDEGKLQLWDIASGALRKSLYQSKEAITDFAYSDDGRWLATTHEKANTVKVGSTHSWAVKYLLKGKGKPVWGVDFAQNKDNKLVVISRTREQLITWRIPTEQ